MAGDEMTGVTIMKLDQGLDTGPVLTAQAVDIGPQEDAGELTQRLARLGASLLVESLNNLLNGDLIPIDQSDEGLTYADKITSEDRPLDISGSPTEFVNHVRGLAPDPGATLVVDGERFRVLAAGVAETSPPLGRWTAIDGWPVARVGDGAVTLLTVQPAGRNPMGGDAWLRGSRRTSGSLA